jgi:transposase
MERRRFTREFKLEAVRLIRDRGVSYAQASEDLKKGRLVLAFLAGPRRKRRPQSSLPTRTSPVCMI